MSEINSVEKEKILNAKNCIDRTASLLSEIINGKPVATACRDSGISYGRMLRFLKSTVLLHQDIHKYVSTPMIFPKGFGLTPYEHLYCTVMEIPVDSYEMAEFPPDCTETVRFVLDRALSGKQKAVICMRFGLSAKSYPMKLDEIGKRMGGLSREYIRIVEKKALEKLRSEPWRTMMENGLEVYNEKRRLDAALEKEKKDMLKKQHSALSMELKRKHMEVMEKINSSPSAEFISTLSNIPIGALELSVRSYNGLHDDGITSLYGLFKRYSEGTIGNISNIGEKSAAEILDKFNTTLLELFGISARKLSMILEIPSDTV